MRVGRQFKAEFVPRPRLKKSVHIIDPDFPGRGAILSRDGEIIHYDDYVRATAEKVDTEGTTLDVNEALVLREEYGKTHGLDNIGNADHMDSFGREIRATTTPEKVSKEIQTHTNSFLREDLQGLPNAIPNGGTYTGYPIGWRPKKAIS